MAASIDDLRGVPLFGGMTDRALQSIADLASDFEAGAGSALTTEGEPGEAFYLITEGRLEVSRGGATISTLGAGDFIGEISLLDGRPRTATAVTLGPVRGLVIRRAAFTELMDRFPPVRLGILMALTERIRRDEHESVA
jgi:CRP-like cAMP-binding protein